MMCRPLHWIWVLVAGMVVLALTERPVYAQRRPLPPPVIVVKPVPKVEIYRATPYWMAVPSYDFRYIVRYPPRPRAYRGVYVGWPWPIYVPYPVPGPPVGSTYGWGREELSGRGVLPEPVPSMPSWEESPSPPSGGLERGPTLAPPEAPPEPRPEDSLPELIPPPMPERAPSMPAPNR